MKRRVTGTFQRANGEPISGILGSFSISHFTHDVLVFYSKEPVYFWTNENGQIVANNPKSLPSGFTQPLGVELVCTNTLDIPVTYTCVLNTTTIEAFDFLLPSGNTTVELQELETTTVSPDDPRYTSLMSYVDDLVDTAIVGVVAGKNKKLVTEVYTANSILSALRIIKVPGQSYADCRNIADMNATKALTEQATTIGVDFNATITGTVFDAGWSWSVNQPIYLGYDGYLKQLIEPNAVFVQQVATSISPQSIFLSIKEPIQL